MKYHYYYKNCILRVIPFHQEILEGETESLFNVSQVGLNGEIVKAEVRIYVEEI